MRDLFKYDLIHEIMRKSPEIRQFSFIPMLTEYDKKTDGNNRITEEIIKKGHRPGTKNHELIEYLQKFEKIEPEKRNFREIQNFFSGKVKKTEIPDPDVFFTNKDRREYFADIPEHMLDSALIFVDPDNGLEVKKSSKKHILYSEVMQLYERMSDDSVLMIYQHFPRVKHDVYRGRRVEELNKNTGAKPLWISDNEIIFFLLAKNKGNHENLKEIISQYSSVYGKCRSVCD